MKIVHVTTGLSDGGAEAILYRLIASDKRANVHVVISMTKDDKYGDMLERKGIDVHYLNILTPLEVIKASVKLYRLLRKISPDVVQTWMYHANLFGGLVSYLAGYRKVVWSIHGPYNKALTSLKLRIMILFSGLLAKIFRYVIVSPSTYAVRSHVNIGYPENLFVSIPNGCDVNLFKPSQADHEVLRRHLNIPTTTAIIGMVARYDPYKDHSNLFSALKILRDSKKDIICLLIGTGMNDENQKLKNTLEEYSIGNMVRLLDRKENIHRWFSFMDIHVLSSISESFPNVLIEAMSCGTPCVVTDVGDTPDIVNNYGWVVPPNDPIKLSEGIKEAIVLLEDDKSREMLSLECREHVVEMYSLELMTRRYMNLWEDVAASGST